MIEDWPLHFVIPRKENMPADVLSYLINDDTSRMLFYLSWVDA